MSQAGQRISDHIARGQKARLEGQSGVLAQALQEWGIIAFTWFTLLGASSNVFLFIVVYAVAFAILAGRFHALGVILHDAIHSAEIVRQRSVWLSLLAGYPITTTPEAMRFHHLRHHRHFGTENDPYLKDGPRWHAWTITCVKGCTLVGAWAVRPLVGIIVLATRRLGAIGFSQSLFQAYARGFLQAKELDPKTLGELEVCLRAEKGQALFFVFIFSLTVWQPAWMVAGYWLPLWFAGFVNVWRVYLEHDHEFRRVGEVAHDETGESGDARALVWRATASVAEQRWVRPFRWILAPRNIGYHQAHHISPTTRLQDLPDLHLRLEREFSFEGCPRSPVESGVVYEAFLGVPILEDPKRASTKGAGRDPADHALIP